MSVVIKVILPSTGSRKLWIRMGQVVNVGRTTAADFEVSDDSQMSSSHLSIECRPDGCFVKDLKSTNGTFLNGQRVDQSRMEAGDELTAGATRLLVQEILLDSSDDAIDTQPESAMSVFPPEHQSILTPTNLQNRTDNSKPRSAPPQSTKSRSSEVVSTGRSMSNADTNYDDRKTISKDGLRMTSMGALRTISLRPVSRNVEDLSIIGAGGRTNCTLLLVFKSDSPRTQIPFVDFVVEYLYPWIPDEFVDTISPRVIAAEYSETALKFVDESWGSSAVSLFIVNQTTENAVERLRFAARGFHDPLKPAQEKHMFKTFDPTHIADVLERCDSTFADNLFEWFDGIVLEAQPPERWRIYQFESREDKR